ncbi:hypothetical protein VTL71DRAFT_4949 [Oculimacula yallundae]|uniref:Uncharacterized protein n=1 Tax=Oculimacula yallundae TaxID=86028 RepID=A0ABR4C3E5_9HELO
MIKIEGHFRTTHRSSPSPVGLVRLLPIYTTVLNSVCLDMRSLSIHMGTETRFLFMGRGVCPSKSSDSFLEMRDGGITGARTDDDLIDKSVERLVHGLPTLTMLQLGDYKTSRPGRDMKWGKARRWVQFVEKREKIIRLKVKVGEEVITTHGDGDNIAGDSGLRPATGFSVPSLFGTRAITE